MVTSVISVANVNPAFAVSVTDAVYTVRAWNGLWFGIHVTLLMVKLPVPVAIVFGIAPVTGAVTFIVAVVIIGFKVGGVTDKLLVAASKPPNVTVTGVSWCTATVNSVPLIGLVVIPSAAKPANTTSLWVESS
jgi:hypothetical protein